MKPHAIGRRFLALTTFGCVLAILACTAIVWALSVPFLKDALDEHLKGLAQQQASAAAFMLDEVFDRAEYLTRLPDIQDLARGATDNTEATDNRITAFRTSAVQNVVVLGFSGVPRYKSAAPSSRSQVFADVEYREGFAQVGRVVQGADRPGRIMLRQTGDAKHTHALIAVPIVVNGAKQGAVVIEKRLALGSMLLGGSRLATPFQKDLAVQEDAAVTARVPGMPLHVIVGGDLAATRAGSTPISLLVMRISFGIAAVLLVPFLAMNFFGRKHLVAPTKALANSREVLARQKEVLKRQSEELRELAAVAELSSEAITVTDRHTNILWVNEAFTQLSGYTSGEAKGRKPGWLLQDELTDAQTVDRIRVAVKSGVPVREEILNVHKSGEHYWIALSISPIVDESGKVQRFASIASDITHRRQIQEALSRAQEETEYQARHDSLTGLPNRRFLDEVLETEVNNDAPPRTIIRVDLDFFKNVNDTHGHAAGDHVLSVVSDLLKAQTSEKDFVARIGGDEFVILLGRTTAAADAQVLCEQLCSEIRNDICFDGKTCRVGASFGVASALDGPLQNEKLLLGADAALYISKEMGRNTTTLYTPEVHEGVHNKRRSSAEIERAIERSEFEPYFQPQIDAKSRKCAGLEALARWRHPDQGLLQPSAFLPLAEQLALTPEIDQIVYEKGLAAVLRLNAKGLAIPKISFNVGAKQLENPQLLAIHKQFDLGATQVAFEVLESVLVEEQASVFALQIDLLRDLGFGVEIDDFGSGHASIVGLMQLRPDVMKVDQRLVFPLNRDPNAITILRSLVKIGKSYGIKITAEGVETEEHAQILTDLEVDTLQGFHFARPLPLGALDEFLRKLRHRGSSAA